MPTTSFGPLDWTIAGCALALMLGAGLSVRRYVGSLEDYLVAKRGLGPWVGAASLVSTEIGMITYMYQAQFGFLAGFSAFAVGLLTLVVCAALGRTGFVITRLREMGIMTVPEYLERRYARGVRVLAGVLMAVGGSLNLGIFPLIEARFLAILTGLDPRHVAWVLAGLLLVALVYTAIGGMVSLIVTNYVQYVLLAAGTVAVTVACLRVTGLGTMTAVVRTRLGAPGFDPLGSPQLGPAFLFWQVLLWTALMTVWQSVAMRTFSTRDTATGRKVFNITSVLFLGRAVIPMAWGIAALAFFSGRAETPVASTDPPSVEVAQVERELARDTGPLLDRGRLEAVLPRVERLETLAAQTGEVRYVESARSHRQELAMVAMPWMLARILPTGIIGLVMAGMLAASLSTYAGYFLGWSAVLAQDVASPLLRRELTGRARLWLTRTSVVGLTVFIGVWSLVYQVPGPAYFYLQVTANLFMAPTLVTVVAGLYWRRASSAGAYLSFLLGAAASLAYLVPGLGLGVAAAGNLSWGLATLGFVLGSLAFPGAGTRAGEAHP